MDWIERVLHGSPDGGDGTVDAVYYAVAVLGVAAFAFRRRLRRSARSRRRER